MTLFRSRVLPAALLFGATLLAFWPVWHGGFIFDDDVFLTNNPLIRAPDGLWRFWFTRQAADYWPLTSSSLWLEWRLWGMHAVGYHVTNLVLHAATVLLVWRLFVRLALPGAFVGALIFALHPVGAESVAWITERKNVLAMLFFVASTWAFIASDAADAKPPTASRSPRIYYAISLAAFVLGMLSKGSVVVLPIVLAGIVLCRRRPSLRDAYRIAPFLAVAVVLGWIQTQFSTVLAAGDVPAGPTLLERCLRAGAVFWFYVGKLVWPANLSFDYGAWEVRAVDWRWWIPDAVILIASAALWRYRRVGTRLLLVGCGYLVVVLLPVMGFIEVGFMKYSPVSNHFAHLAVLGWAALTGVTWATAVGHVARARWLATSGVILLAMAFGALTWRQATIFADPFQLYRDTIAHNPNSWLARTNLGVLLNEAGASDAAIEQLSAAVRIRPDFARAHNDLGIAYYKTDRLADAVREYQTAIQLDPTLAEARNNLGAAFARQGDLAAAVRQFEAALVVSPDYAPAQQNLAKARSLLHDPER